MIPYLGDFRLGDLVEHYIDSSAADGSSVAIASNDALRLYKAGSSTELGTSVTLTKDFDGLTGVHRVSLTLTGAGITPGANYVVVLPNAVVDGVTVNVPLFTFSCHNRGTHVVSRGTLAAVSGSGGTFQAGTYARVNDGDAVRILHETDRADYAIIDTLNTGTGVFTLREAWTTLSSVGAYYEVHEAPKGQQLTAADIASDAITAAKIAADAVSEIQSGLALAADLATVDTNVDALVTGQAAQATAAALATVDANVDSLVTGQAAQATAADLASLDSDVAALDGDIAALSAALATAQADLDNLQTRVPAALVSGKMDVALTADGLDTTAVDEIVAAMFARLIFAGFSFERVVKIIFAGASGPSEDVALGQPKYKDPSGTTTLIDATASLGDRVINSYGS